MGKIKMREKMIMLKVDFTDRIVIVTGAGKGIGKETAIRFAQSGAKVVLAGYREKSINETKKEIEKITKDVIAVIADVANWPDSQKLVKETIGRYEKIDILINNAGMDMEDKEGKPLKPMNIGDEEYDRIINVNMKGQFNCTKAVLPFMIERKYGRIVNLGSTTGIRGHYGSVAYCGAKAGIMAQTMVFAREFGAYNITVNCVAPGLILTPLHDNTPKEILEMQAKQIALGRPGFPSDVVHAILFFATEELFVTGQTLVVDGGNTMR
jgi:3-oxoacyl-[acyl-carrier protein] reductase